MCVGHKVPFQDLSILRVLDAPGTSEAELLQNPSRSVRLTKGLGDDHQGRVGAARDGDQLAGHLRRKTSALELLECVVRDLYPTIDRGGLEGALADLDVI